jgi:hypothetical protein
VYQQGEGKNQAENKALKMVGKSKSIGIAGGARLIQYLIAQGVYART